MSTSWLQSSLVETIITLECDLWVVDYANICRLDYYYCFFKVIMATKRNSNSCQCYTDYHFGFDFIVFFCHSPWLVLHLFFFFTLAMYYSATPPFPLIRVNYQWSTQTMYVCRILCCYETLKKVGICVKLMIDFIEMFIH